MGEKFCLRPRGIGATEDGYVKDAPVDGKRPFCAIGARFGRRTPNWFIDGFSHGFGNDAADSIVAGLMQSMIATYPLSELRLTIAQEVEGNAHLRAIRDHNRTIIGELEKMSRLSGVAMLDLGASIHGYGLEAALDAGVQLYE